MGGRGGGKYVREEEFESVCLCEGTCVCVMEGICVCIKGFLSILRCRARVLVNVSVC